MREQSPNQKTRFILLLFEVGILCMASWLAFGRFFPSSGNEGFWFYTALLGLLLGSRLDTPFFAKPADVLLYAAPAGVSLALCNQWPQWSATVQAAYCMALGYCIVVGLIAVVAMMMVGVTGENKERISNVARILAESLGSPQIIYSIVVAFALYAFHWNSPVEVITILGAWVLTGVYSAPEFCWRLGRRVRRAATPSTQPTEIGEVIAYQTPGRVLIRQSMGRKIACGEVVALRDPLDHPRIAIVLDRFGRDEGILLRAVELGGISIPAALQTMLSFLSPGSVVNIDHLPECTADPHIKKCKSAIVGLVTENSSISRLYIDVIANTSLCEGTVLEVEVDGMPVLYQVTNGLTQEEAVFQKNTRGFARAEARKVGKWNDEKKTFQVAKWIPEMHAPVFLAAGPAQTPDGTAIGHLPRTNFPVRLSNIHDLVTHNAAILGILGVGKSVLAFELVERMILAGIKVVCLDLTNEYAEHLAPFYDATAEAACLEKIRIAGDKDRENVEDSKSAGGSLDNLRAAIGEDLTTFLADTCQSKLKIYNPAQITASIQYGELRNKKVGPGQNDWKAVAGFRETTPAEITRIITETCLSLVQDRMRTEAKVCLVFEEAHTLIPEYNNLTVEMDKHAVAGTARAILQGRKYGMGCLLISQRTANVTKTILNQCNSIFAFRTFDDTGMAFLENYLGSDFAHVLPSLEERHVVFFGKASSCENPVLMRVNNREDILKLIRPAAAPSPPAQPKVASPTAAAPSAGT